MIGKGLQLKHIDHSKGNKSFVKMHAVSLEIDRKIGIGGLMCSLLLYVVFVFVALPVSHQPDLRWYLLNET